MSAFFIWPTENDVGAAGEGRAITEAKWEIWGQAMQPINSVLTGCGVTQLTGKALLVASGTALINGVLHDFFNETYNPPLADDTMYHIWLQTSYDVGSKIDETDVINTTDTSIPLNAVLLAAVFTGTGTIASIQDRRPQPWGTQNIYDTSLAVATYPNANKIVLGYQPRKLVTRTSDPYAALGFWDVTGTIGSSQFWAPIVGAPANYPTIETYGFSVVQGQHFDVASGYFQAEAY